MNRILKGRINDTEPAAQDIMTSPLLRTIGAVILLASTSHGEARLLIQSASALDPHLIQWAAGDTLLVSKSRRGEIRVWKSDSGTLLQVLPPVDPMRSSIAVSSDGAMIASIRNGRAVVMDRLTGENIWEDKETGANSLTRLEPPFLTIASGGLVKRIDFTKGKTTHQWKVDENHAVKDIDLLKDGATAVFLNDRTAVVLDEDFKESGRIVPEVPSQYYYGTSAGETLALATMNGVYVSSIRDKHWKKATSSPAVEGVALSPDGLALAAGGAMSKATIRSTVDMKELWQTAPVHDTNDLAWSSDQSKLAFATGSHGIAIIDAKSCAKLLSFGTQRGIDPLDVADSILMDGRSQWLGLLSKKGKFVHVALSDGNVHFFELNQKIQPATRPQSESANDIIWTKNPVKRFQIDGVLIEKPDPPSSDVFDSGACGADGIYFRAKRHVFISRMDGGKTVKEGMFPLGMGFQCVFTADGRHALHDAPAEQKEYVVRKALTWEVVGAIPKSPEDDALTAAWVAPDQQFLTWMGSTRMSRYDFKTGLRSELISCSGYDNATLPRTHASVPEWFMVFSSFANPVQYKIHSASDSSVLHESRQWRTFADEIDLRVLGVTKNTRGLWLCGSGMRPVLVDLKSGQPVLRLHVFEDSTHLWETADGIVAGSPDAKSKCLLVSEDGMNAMHDPKRVKWDMEKVKSILMAYSH